MILYITEQQLKKMENTIIDEQTGMTQFDYWEYYHPTTEIIIIEETKEEGR